ncbi:MAG: PP2C family protein-serine/threonine phosphatase [Acidobacteriota bacterium]
MIASTIFQDAVAQFLSNVAKYTGIPFCLTDQDDAIIVRTPADADHPYSTEIGYGTRRPIRLRDETVWHLYTLDQPLPGTEILREQVLDFTAEVIVFIITNEEEMQNLSNELIERYQELHVLYDVINDVSTVLDEEGICTAVLQKAMQTLDVRLGAVAFLDGTASRIRCMEGDASLVGRDELVRFAEQVSASNTHLIIERKNPEPPSRFEPAVLAVPVTANNAPIGSMIVAEKRSGENFTTGDRISLTALAGYLGIAMKTALLIRQAHEAESLRREFDFARRIQMDLLPKRLPAISTLDIAARCMPAAQVGGDLFTFFELGNSEWAFGVADVSGHGLGAAFILASLRSILRSECRSGEPIEAIVRKTNDTLCEDTEDTEMFATLFMASYDDATRRLRTVNAGHPQAILRRAQTRTLSMLGSGGMAAGLFRDESYEFDEVTLERGDVLALYTDGIIERKNPEGAMYGIERLCRFMLEQTEGDADTIMKKLLDDLAAFQGTAPQSDDVTIVIAKVR